MPVHIHAALMAEYAKDALKTDKPWERWQYRCSERMPWASFKDQMCFVAVYEYRRKPVALCQVEGRDVFPGDKLWWKTEGRWITAVRHAPDTTRGLILWDHETWYALDNLSWTEPTRTKTVYQWAMRCQGTPIWYMTAGFFETEQEAARNSGDSTANFRRLDWTALEVPA